MSEKRPLSTKKGKFQYRVKKKPLIDQKGASETKKKPPNVAALRRLL